MSRFQLFGLLLLGLFLPLRTTQANADELWTPEDLDLASHTALSVFQSYFYDHPTWKQIQNYYTEKTPMGAVVSIGFYEDEIMRRANFICYYIDLNEQKQMECREH